MGCVRCGGRQCRRRGTRNGQWRACRAKRTGRVAADAMPMEHIVVVGDPGTGKSTLLSTMCKGAAQFKSGLSIGTGMTAALQTEVVDGKRYSDTPGLNDASKKQAAANAISDAIILGGAVKLIFVVTLEAGRLRQSNLATVRLVLDALVAKGIQVDGLFSIIINKMSPGEVVGWTDPALGGPALLADQINRGFAADLLLFLGHVPLLVDAGDSRLPAAEAARLDGMLAEMRSMTVPRGTHIDVQVGELEALTERVVRELAAMRTENQEDRIALVAQLTKERNEALAKATESKQDIDAIKARYEDDMRRARGAHNVWTAVSSVASAVGVALPGIFRVIAIAQRK